ncbi:MAG: ATP-binding protein [Prevotellaceae bacterium]|jgi:signal transduction histidine kinase|nr:ATP-binding protein [Prevotellaceae bacterium]
MDELYFSVKTGLKNIIGKDLITDDNIAIFELVKNSYDARANDVVITFEKNKITISDDGKGMSYSDLCAKWLAVAYSAKNDGTEDIEENSDDDRDDKRVSYRDKINVRKYYAGAKGIGRFSCDRLGSNLILTTQKEGQLIEQLTISWNEFEKDQKEDFEKVKVPHHTLDKYPLKFPNNSKHGTILEIENTEDWDRGKITALKHSLEKLINPFSETTDFNIEIICERERQEDNALKKDKNGNDVAKYIDRDKINGKINNSIIDIFKLKTTQIVVRIDNSTIETKLIDRETLIYHIKEKNKFNPFIDNLSINLYYLNRSAKFNFTKKMGVEPVNYGSIFLFKNGFRVQPYGNTGDDSWGLDFRAQQGYNRFLSSRDLFGRVDITTDNTGQFKEVSSRDGGLVETNGYRQLIDVFFLKGFKRLERYVTGVLWGEAFKRNTYFKSDDDAQKFRDELLLKDKDSEDVSIAKSNVGSKIDFIRLIRNLSDERDVEIVEFNKDLVDVINENLEEVQPKFIKDLEKIAETTGDSELHQTITRTEAAFRKLQQEKEDAERRALEEEQKRKEAEKRARDAEEEKWKAEQRAKKEEEKRQKAEFDRVRAENERIKAENEKLKAEQRAKEEEKKRKEAENTVKKREEQIKRSRAADTIEYKDLRDSNHIIGVYSDDISKKILLLKRKMDSGETIPNKELLSFIKGVSFANEKISTLTRFTTKSNFLEALIETKEDIVNYIRVYLEDIYKILYDDIDIEFISNNISFVKTFEPIELCTAIDNILSNSRKKKALKIIFEFYIDNAKTCLSIKDIGKPLDSLISNYSMIFEEGITTTKGAGLGLSHVKRIVEDNLKGKISYNPKYTDGFELIITFSS